MSDSTSIERVDAGNMLALIGRFGAMTAEGWRAAERVALPAPRPSAIVVCGMGGSGIGGDLLRALAAFTSPVPVVVHKNDRLPAFVDAATLVFVCSYSGNTEETLAAFREAAQRGARIVAVTSGGALARLVHEARGTVVAVPPGLPPRAALPLLLMPMVRIAAALGAVSVADGEVAQTVAVLEPLAGRWGAEAAPAANPTLTLAHALDGAIPAVYSTSPLTEPAARRWRTQLNENSKTLATDGAFPELTHNEVVGWEGVDPALPWHVVLLRDKEEGPRDLLRVRAARDAALHRARGCTEVWSVGEHPLSRLLSLVLFGDFVSCYLAQRRGIDPTPVATIDRIKERLRTG
jgi:glucose/mannose-6-phosphate isomerase